MQILPYEGTWPPKEKILAKARRSFEMRRDGMTCKQIAKEMKLTASRVNRLSQIGWIAWVVTLPPEQQQIECDRMVRAACFNDAILPS